MRHSPLLRTIRYGRNYLSPRVPPAARPGPPRLVWNSRRSGPVHSRLPRATRCGRPLDAYRAGGQLGKPTPASHSGTTRAVARASLSRPGDSRVHPLILKAHKGVRERVPRPACGSAARSGPCPGHRLPACPRTRLAGALMNLQMASGQSRTRWTIPPLLTRSPSRQLPATCGLANIPRITDLRLPPRPLPRVTERCRAHNRHRPAPGMAQSSAIP